MEPIAVFSLAGTILQFVDSGSKFVRIAHKLYRSTPGDSGVHGELHKLTNDLDALLPKLEAGGSGNDGERSLGQLTYDCGKTAVQLLAILQKVTGAEITRKRDALKAAFRSIIKEDEIKSLADRLTSFRAQLNLHLLVSLREHASKSAEQQEAGLRKLGIIHDETLKIGGLSAAILEYLASRRGSDDHIKGIRSLQQDLVHTINNTEWSGKDSLGASSIQLSPTERQRAQAIFLASLQYDSMIDRESRIATAHETTFQWVFQDGKSQDNTSRKITSASLRDWLLSDDQQLYWITGKPGSGKSTLMKFLCSPVTQAKSDGSAQKSRKLSGDLHKDETRCWPYLQRWAGESELIVASFYFWNSGVELQMTYLGLLRTLLHQLLAQRPDILPLVASKQWESLCMLDHRPGTWSLHDLYRMLFLAVNEVGKDSKICLFIDGLDEFSGGHEELVGLVKNLIKQTSTVKVCVASRPWDIFQEAFGKKANLRLEDLTFGDIKNFVQSKFHEDTEFENLRRRYPSFANQLMDNIVTKASGVFLWVDLVVASLLAGMRLGDRIEDFQRRLDELPPDLEQLYEKILQSLDKFYLGHAAQYFSLVETVEAPLTILQFSFVDEESPDTAIKMGMGSLPPEDIAFRVEGVNRRLNSRCKGFLEVERGLQGNRDQGPSAPAQLTVQYLHRTVRDFIKTPKAQEFLQSSTDPNFDPSMQLCLAYLMDLKHWLDRVEDWSRSDLSAIYCLRRAARVTKTNEGAVVQLLEELKRVLDLILMDTQDTRFRQRTKYSRLVTDSRMKQVEQLLSGRIPSFHHLQNSKSSSTAMTKTPALGRSFISLACAHGVVPYVRAGAEWGGFTQPSSANADGDRWPLLLDALSSDVPEPRMVECLLDLGADPNFKVSNVDSQTALMVALTKTTLLCTLPTEFGSPEEYVQAENKWKEVLKLMISRGATVTKAQESLLMPMARRILQELTDEVKPQSRGPTGLSKWLGSWMTG